MLSDLYCLPQTVTYKLQKEGTSYAGMHGARKTRGAVNSQPDSCVVLLGARPRPDSWPAMSHLCPHPSETILAKPMAIALSRGLAYTSRVGRGVGQMLASNTRGALAVCRREAESACRVLLGRKLWRKSKGSGSLGMYLLILCIHFCFYLFEK